MAIKTLVEGAIVTVTVKIYEKPRFSIRADLTKLEIDFKSGVLIITQGYTLYSNDNNRCEVYFSDSSIGEFEPQISPSGFTFKKALEGVLEEFESDELYYLSC